MAINKNHEFDELDGIKCGIVEKNVSAGRVEFLKKILTLNGYTVVVVPTPPPKVVPAKPVAATKPALPDTETIAPEVLAPSPAVVAPVVEVIGGVPPSPETFTIGVTDYTFNPINAIFGRLLHTPANHVVTLAYWQQTDPVSNDEVPYYANT